VELQPCFNIPKVIKAAYISIGVANPDWHLKNYSNLKGFLEKMI